MSDNHARPGKMCATTVDIREFRSSAITAHEPSRDISNCQRLANDLVDWTIAAERRLGIGTYSQFANDIDRASLSLHIKKHEYELEIKSNTDDRITIRCSEHFQFRLNEICILYQTGISKLLRIAIDAILAEAIIKSTFKPDDNDNH